MTLLFGYLLWFHVVKHDRLFLNFLIFAFVSSMLQKFLKTLIYCVQVLLEALVSSLPLFPINFGNCVPLGWNTVSKAIKVQFDCPSLLIDGIFFQSSWLPGPHLLGASFGNCNLGSQPLPFLLELSIQKILRPDPKCLWY